jgi:hypothetical protein
MGKGLGAYCQQNHEPKRFELLELFEGLERVVGS